MSNNLGLELRIGNCLSFDGNVRVSEIHSDGFWCTDSDGCTYKSKWAEIEPIKLSDEILKKVGFVRKKTIDRLYWHKSYIKIDKSGDSYFYVTGLNITEVKSFHQLENLYFAITGKELGLEP
jgi:hypothetical protein